MDRRKGFAFHPEDWLSDTRLALCSYATKGAWMDILCHMFQSPRAGYLMVDGKALKKEDVQRMLKCRTQEEFETIWNELLSNGVMKQHADGTYYSKRMVQDVERISLNGTATKSELDLAQKVLVEFKHVVKDARSYDGDRARTLIIGLYREGVRFEDFKSVISSKYEQWSNIDTMKQWLRPATIFGPKFKEYLAESKEQAPSTPSGGFIPRFDYRDM